MSKWFHKDVESIGPSPLPDHAYKARVFPVRGLMKLFRWLIVLVLILSLLGIIGVLLLYRLPAAERALTSAASVFPLPALRVNEQTVLLRTYDNILALAPDDAARDRVRTRLTNRLLLEQMAQQYGVTLDPFAVDAFWKEVTSGEVSADYTDATMGWSEELFRMLVLETVVYERALTDVLYDQEELQAGVKERARELHAEAFADAGIFEELSVEEELGDFGTLQPIGHFPVEARASLLHIPVGTVAPLIELHDRFVIYRVADRVGAGESARVYAQTLDIQKKDVHGALETWRQDAEIVYYLREGMR